jgi:predicted nuclease with TOPRIM domain
LNPARYNAADDDDVPRHKPKVDYSATLETAYDNLDKLLSSNAIKNMTEDTGRLAEKQKQLMGNIEKIQPVMEKAKGILESFDMGSISKLMENIGVGAKMLDKAEPPAA